MLNRLQPFMRKSKVFEEIFQAQSTQLNERKLLIEDLEKQLNIDTATWALKIYEESLGLISDSNKPLLERRSKIKAKRRGIGKVDLEMIKLVVSSWTGGTVDVKFINGKIIIKFIDLLGVPENMDDVFLAIEEIKPAHLGFEFEYLYITWNQFDNYNNTWDEWDVLNLTWDQFETYEGA